MPPNACRCERAWSQLCAAAGPSCEDVGPGVPRFQWESLDMAAAAKNKMSPLLHILFHASSKLRFQENSLAWMCSLSFPQDESGHACSHRSTVPTSGSRSRCHGNRHLFASRALGRGARQRRRRGPEEAKASPTSAPLEPRRGFDGDGDGTPAFISSSASQELFECAVSATCERFSPVPVHLQLDRVSPCCYFTAAFTSGCCKLLPASLSDLYRSGDDITNIK